MYEVFEHTADLGLRIRADDMGGLFSEAGCGLTSVIVDELGKINSCCSQVIELEADSVENLLVDWLSELLYLFETKGLVFCVFDVAVCENENGNIGLRGTVEGEWFDRSRHGAGNEVKAITYHGLKIEQDKNGFVAELIMDI